MFAIVRHTRTGKEFCTSRPLIVYYLCDHFHISVWCWSAFYYGRVGHGSTTCTYMYVLCTRLHITAKGLSKSMPFIQKSITDWIVKFSQKSSLLHDFSDFKEVHYFSDGLTTQSWSDYNVIWCKFTLLRCLDRPWQDYYDHVHESVNSLPVAPDYCVSLP